MSRRNVRLIFLREVRDQLRDRRTLFMVVVLPLLLYPALGIGMTGMTVTFSRQERIVAIVGAEDLPGPPLLDGDAFAARWFEDPEQAELLKVVSDGEPADRESIDAGQAGGTEEGATDRAATHAAIQRLREAQSDLERLDAEVQAATKQNDLPAAREREDERDAAAVRRSRAFAASGMQVVVFVPPEMKERLAAANERLRTRDDTSPAIEIPKLLVFFNGADEKSLIAYRGVREALDRWNDELLKQRLRVAGVPVDLPEELAPKPVDLASDEQRSQTLWSKLFPALLVIMTVTGAFYPAVDLAAGEKERGTMETLLICPASRTEIVVGKFLTVMLFSSLTALLNLLTMGVTARFIASMTLGSTSSEIFSPPLASIGWVVVLLLPLAGLFSALCLSLATFARSSKEGQYHLTPLLLVTMGLTVFCLSPAVEITPLYSVLPVVGLSLLLKELLAGGDGYVYLVPVLVTSLGYAALALWWAVEQFNREDILFREAEQFELKLWLRRLFREKKATPGFGTAAFCFVMIMLLQFGAMRIFAGLMQDTDPGEYPVRVLQILLVQQLAIVAGPALLMGVLLTTSLKSTFRLRWPSWHHLAVATVLPFALMPLATTLLEKLSWFFPPLPPSIVETLRLLGDGDVPLWLTLLAFAAAPALCEELTFRGFLLSGFLTGRRPWLAIVLSSLAFGLMHLIPQQVFNATLLGLVLGLMTVRSGSLWPGVLFHFLFNGSQVALGRLGSPYLSDGYPWPVLVLCTIVAVPLIVWLIRGLGDSSHESSRYSDPDGATNRDDQPVGTV